VPRILLNPIPHRIGKKGEGGRSNNLAEKKKGKREEVNFWFSNSTKSEPSDFRAREGGNRGSVAEGKEDKRVKFSGDFFSNCRRGRGEKKEQTKSRKERKKRRIRTISCCEESASVTGVELRQIQKRTRMILQLAGKEESECLRDLEWRRRGGIVWR